MNLSLSSKSLNSLLPAHPASPFLLCSALSLGKESQEETTIYKASFKADHDTSIGIKRWRGNKMAPDTFLPYAEQKH